MNFPLINGIACGGQWIMDRTKEVAQFPSEESVAMILAETPGCGGGACNVLMNLAKMDAAMPLAAVGLIGRDSMGDAILHECERHPNVDLRQLCRTSQMATSYTDVFSVRGTGRRTFFHYPGSNRLFGLNTVDLDALGLSHFHLAYLLLLESLDAEDAEYGRKSARFLAELKRRGITTSLDLVSLDHPNYSDIVKPALPYTDYCIINDFEAQKLTGRALRLAGQAQFGALEEIAAEILAAGVEKWVVIHYPEGAYALGKNGNSWWQPSLDLPRDYIVGATGAGDAFCAGVLYGQYRGWPMDETLRFAVCAGAKSLSHVTATGAMTSWQDIKQLETQFRFRTSEHTGK